jgi:Spy/CpxP family protein refolding chaperone
MSIGRPRIVLLLTLVLLSSAGQAQEPTPQQKPGHPQPGQPPPGADPIGSKLFPPELIMSHQQELAVDEPQRAAILKEIEKAQSQLLPLQWQMHAATEQLVKALETPKIDEAKALAQADKLMTMERDLKRTHLGMLIRIRNLLTEQQRAKLMELRAKGAP